ncbi:hypothetical protein [Convivina intestini]|uniref:Uncharacterized protein n=1 Tax=Convivina intestini TaxID=1505726 RepID=A0A2U1DFT4_9LACO|nr:hypothetical protein [Convivina intestini]PVY86514.1 hypothetical protein C7384_101434 [Convivina intestini]CAH1857475.1 hypothetical protein R077811_01524 [Convivina intestini]SDC13158.1 hypothetical protein SAMN05216341_11419 [Leuconostocaceae bacterium R-53105]
MYLNYVEYNDLIGDDLELKDFNKLLKKATIQLDNVTNGFYELKHSLDDDLKSSIFTYIARAKAFKQALGLTIDFMNQLQVTNVASLNTDGTADVQIGDTHIQGAGLSGTITNGYGSVIPDEAIQLLGRHGLLYRGGL